MVDAKVHHIPSLTMWSGKPQKILVRIGFLNLPRKKVKRQIFVVFFLAFWCVFWDAVDWNITESMGKPEAVNLINHVNS